MTENMNEAANKPSARVDIVFGILLSGFMATVFAALMPLMALGFTYEWLMAWGMGVVVGWPLGFLLVSLVQRPIRRLAVRFAA